MSKQQILILRGLPASGKTTFAKAWVEEDPENRVRVNRDDIRLMLGPYWVPKRERLVTKIENENIKQSVCQGYSIVVDATNFKKTKNDWKHLIEYFLYDKEKNITIEDIEISFMDFDIPVDECIERDGKRERPVGKDVILNMAKKYLNYENAKAE